MAKSDTTSLGNEDCPSCRLIGSAVPVLAGCYVLKMGSSNLQPRQGWQRAGSYGTYAIFGVGLISMGLARWFDLGPFKKKK